MGQSVLTTGFTRADASAGGAVWCEGVSLEEIARDVGTPVYVYSKATIRDRYQRLDRMLATVPHRIHYTLKANSSLGVLSVLRELGAGADVVSGGELRRAARAGFTPNDIIFGGVGKTKRELEEALDAGVLLINVESEAEVRLLDTLAAERETRARVSLRVNPEVTLDSPHEYIKTGGRGHKFGIPFDDVLHVAKVAASLPNVDLIGLDMHLGSQLSRIDPYREGTERLASIFAELTKRGINTLQYLDLGGGLGVRYDTELPPDLHRFAELVLPTVYDTGLHVIMEPGRFVIGNAGALVTEVLYRKHSGGKDYVVVDAGMTELLRPSHYGAFHRILAMHQRSERKTVDVVGPVCESGDFLALDRELDDVQPGDHLVVCDVGAYGYAMASNYNSRLRPAEVLVDGDRFAVITQREQYDDLLRREIESPEWKYVNATREQI
ncbi:MAG TPA: diaminopimelate decarboxylase [Gemmatimonadaceae bacterium]|jgi:diaminopimelate decarboxylase|nr:diaminopimelate decarboxylase [Gemmatimonadaceae bacterium]